MGLRDDYDTNPADDPRVKDALERLYQARPQEPEYGPVGGGGCKETEDEWAMREHSRREALRDLKRALDSYGSGWDESDRFH